MMRISKQRNSNRFGQKLNLIFSCTWLVLLLTTVISVSCSAVHTPATSSTQDLVFDRNSRNVALFFGAPTNLTGVTIDINKQKSLFEDPTMNFGFKVVTKNRATKNDILGMTKQYSAEVSENGTLLWYFSGHGMQSGQMFTQDQRALYFKEVSAAIQSVRNTPLKRLIVVIDNCFAGTNLEGSSAIIPQGAALTTVVSQNSEPDELTRQAYVEATADDINSSLSPVTGTRSTNRLYEQALVLVASRSNETSLDGNEGGVFSEAWRKTLASLRKGAKRATLRDMVVESTSRTKIDSNGHHTPVYRASPSDVVLNDYLFDGSTQAVTPGGNAGGSSVVPLVVGPALLLGETGADGSVPVYVSGASTMGIVAMCKGSDASCRTTPTTVANFAVTSEHPVAGMAVFKSEVGITLEENQEYTILTFDTSRTFTGSKTFKFKKK